MRLANERLAERLRLSELSHASRAPSSTFPSTEVDGAIQGWLGRLGSSSTTIETRYCCPPMTARISRCCIPGVGPASRRAGYLFARRDYPWAARELGHMRPFVAARLDDLHSGGLA